jgi:hypothetical protein
MHCPLPSFRTAAIAALVLGSIASTHLLGQDYVRAERSVRAVVEGVQPRDDGDAVLCKLAASGPFA